MSKFNVGDIVRINGTSQVGKIIYQNPDGRLSELRIEKYHDWPRMYRDEELCKAARPIKSLIQGQSTSSSKRSRA